MDGLVDCAVKIDKRAAMPDALTQLVAGDDRSCGGHQHREDLERLLLYAQRPSSFSQVVRSAIEFIIAEREYRARPLRQIAFRPLVVGAIWQASVTNALDHRVLRQEAVPVLPGDTAESLHARIQSVEHRILPAVVREMIAA